MTAESVPCRERIHYNPVNVRDSIGTIALGIVTLALLAALLRAHSENRRLLAEFVRSVTEQES
jgi:hypothetical protein